MAGMRRVSIPFFLVVILSLLAGCRGATTPTSNVPTAPPTVPPTLLTAPSTVPPTLPARTCRAVPSIFASLPAPDVPPVTDADWMRGRADAPVTLIEYGDFQCPACARVASLLALVEEAHKDNLRAVYRHFPLTSIHDKAQITAEAAEAAGSQGKFWEMHDLLFERQQEWARIPADQMPQVLAGYAEELGLDVARFTKDLEDHTYQDKVMAQYQDAVNMGLPGTPSLIVNGRMYPIEQWGISYQGISALIGLALLEPRLYSAPPALQIDPTREYVATIRTPNGDIVIELYAAQAPLNVNSFIFLARQGWYDGTTFFRVIPGFVVQAGDPTGTAAGNPGFQCDNEIGDLKFDAAGVVGIANAGPNTGSSQFFITLAAQPDLDGHYTIIGKVVRGMEILQALPERTPDPAAPPGLLIEEVQIEER